MRKSLLPSLVIAGIAFSAFAAAPSPVKVGPLLKSLQSVGPEGVGQKAAVEAWQKLSQADVAQLPEILAGLDGANPLAANWIRGAVDTIAECELEAGGKLPAAALEKFVLDTKHSPRGRRLAFEWLARVDATAPDRLIPQMLNDPSVEFRRDAVARLLAEAEPLAKADDKSAVPIYQKALAAARDEDQINLIADQLTKFGETVDLPTHFGFLTEWKLIGPFDNTDKIGYATAYPPEKEQEFDFTAEHEGKGGLKLTWNDHVTDDKYGNVDLNKALGKNMGAVAYAVTTFESPKEQTVDFRLTCTNANKLWVNGELVTQNEVYHAGSSIDQYITPVKLKKGRNVILVKACQDEQTEPWTQNWQFQLRVCDPTGTAILSANRGKANGGSAKPAAGGGL
jgi:hypothetical protein